MKTEAEKAEETLKWLDLFDLIRIRVNQYAINAKTFNLGIKKEIETLREGAEKIINIENERNNGNK